MAERPILFSAPMIRALLAGTKTQTRRAMKPQPQRNGGAGLVPIEPYRCPDWRWNWVIADTGMGTGDPFACPYGVPGDRLWVREAWRTDAHAFDGIPPRDIPAGSFVAYEAGLQEVPFPAAMGKLRPGMFMPRWASRITLEVTGVRVERLQEISEADAKAEGVAMPDGTPTPPEGWSYRQEYGYLWDRINGEGSWDANPWVWIVEFRRLTPRI